MNKPDTSNREIAKPESQSDIVHSRKARPHHVLLAALMAPIWFYIITSAPLPDIGYIFVTLYVLPGIAIFLGLSALIEWVFGINGKLPNK